MNNDNKKWVLKSKDGDPYSIEAILPDGTNLINRLYISKLDIKFRPKNLVTADLEVFGPEEFFVNIQKEDIRFMTPDGKRVKAIEYTDGSRLEFMNEEFVA